MKNFLIAIILTIVISKHYIQCFRVNDICFSNEKKCNATSRYKFQCSSTYCAKSEHTCKQYTKAVQNLKSMRILRLKMALERMFESQIQKLDDLFKMIGMCEGKPKHVDVCFNNQNCLLVQKLPLRFAGVGLVTIGNCPCAGAFHHACDNDYCAKSKFECDKFLMNKSFYSRNAPFCSIASKTKATTTPLSHLFL